MIIGIDLRCLPAAGEPGAGIAHAARELSLALIGLGLRHQWIVYMPVHAEGVETRSGNARIVRLGSVSGAAMREALREAPCDILFVPSGAISPGLPVTCVPWVHDVAIFDHPEWFPQPIWRRLLTTHVYRRGVQAAPLVLTVSDDTRREVMRLFDVQESRMRVTHEGGDLILADLHGDALVRAKQRARHRLAERGITQAFILCLGTLEPRKNIPFLLSAWGEAKRWFDRPVDMVIAGKDGWKLAPITQALDHGHAFDGEGGSRIHRVDAISDDDKRDLLLAAEIVAVPSLHEGFGLVAMEAMQAATAVMASDVGALPEVVGEAGILLPTQEKKAWARAMADLMNNNENRQHMAEQGKARSQGMTWKRAAEITLHALTEASR